MKPLSELLSLHGQRAIITGAAMGIGKAISFRFAEAGATLDLIDINTTALEKLQGELTSYEGEVRIHTLDLSKKTAIDEFWAAMKGNPPTILVNNAGIFPMKPFLEVDEAFLQHVLDVNLLSVYWMCQHLVRQGKKQGGVIVNISSVEAILPFRNELAHYDMSKAAVIAFSRAIAKEFGKKGFRVNTLLPGGIITPGTKKIAKQIAKLKFDIIKSGIEFRSRLPIGRFGKPDDIARMILVLASDLASYVHGAVIPVDGGFLSA